jgi:hypothetical protein
MAGVFIFNLNLRSIDMEEVKEKALSVSILSSQDSQKDVFWSAWESFEQVTGYEHEPLSDQEHREANMIRKRMHSDYSIPVFITDLKMEYNAQVIETFLFERFGINLFVDSMRRRTTGSDCENQYDVHLWADEGDYLKILLWEEIHPDFVVRKHAACEISAGIREYLTILPHSYFLFVKRQLDHITSADDPSGLSLDNLLKNYCDTLCSAKSEE